VAARAELNVCMLASPMPKTALAADVRSCKRGFVQTGRLP
jgi:hypothetical protein